ncbi:hypothetical protein D9757_013177 [Collybiopsis confluens]|uniref:Uncharacterized protein n=1 Tax=Collybiopsis confluens TaxID=2823264 RepID=A0A8H5D5R4_9AGAR|nr:hypothetical protein D9757_013177 [Collybiopsis confluens]
MTTPTPAKVTFAEPALSTTKPSHPVSKAKVTFAEPALSTTKPSHPVSKKVKIPSLKAHGPRVLGIVLPHEKMFARLVEVNPKHQELVDAHDEWRLAMEVNLLIAIWCDDLEEKEIWPHGFRIMVDLRSQTTCCQALGLTKNTTPESRNAPTIEQIRQIREYLRLPREEYPLVWCRDQSKI